MKNSILEDRTAYRKNASNLPTNGFKSHAHLFSAILPDDNNLAEAKAFFRGKYLSVSSDVVKFDKPYDGRCVLCQDSSMVLVEPNFTVTGVFDGFGDSGEVLSRFFIDELFREFHAKRSISFKEEDFKSSINLAIEFSSLNAQGFIKKIEGGTTAIVALILNDGTYFLACIGDSAIYKFSKTGLQRLSDNSMVGCMKNESGVLGYSVLPYTQIDLKQYLDNRHLVLEFLSSIGLSGSNPKINFLSGHLEKSEKLILVTDGITKNLSIIIGLLDLVKDASGVSDLQEIIKTKASDRFIGRAVLKAVRERIASSRETSLNDILKSRTDGTVLVPQDDDRTVVVVKKF